MIVYQRVTIPIYPFCCFFLQCHIISAPQHGLPELRGGAVLHHQRARGEIAGSVAVSHHKRNLSVDGDLSSSNNV